MEGSVGLLKHECVRATKQNGDGFSLVGAAGDLDDLGRTTSGLLNNEVGVTEHVRLQVINVSNWGAVDGSADKINLASVDVLDNHNLHLGEEVESELGNGLTEDGLLEEQNVCARFLNLLAQVDNVFFLFLKESVHSGVVMDDNVALKIGLGGGEGELDEGNLGISNSSWATSVVRGFLVNKAETIDELRVIDGTAKLG